MTAATLDLQEAVFQTLRQDVALVTALRGTKFHDLTPANLGFPYVTFGRTSVYDWSTGTEMEASISSRFMCGRSTRAGKRRWS